MLPITQAPGEILYRELVRVRVMLESLVDSTVKLRDDLDWKERLSFISASRDTNIELEKALADAEAMVAKAEEELSGRNVVSLSSLSRLNKVQRKDETVCPGCGEGRIEHSLVPPPARPVNANDVRHLETQLISKGCRIPVPQGTGSTRGKISDILNSKYGPPKRPSSDDEVPSLVDYVGTNVVIVKALDEASKVISSAASSLCSDILCRVVEMATECLEKDSSNQALRLCDTVINDGFPRILVKK